MRLRLIRNDHNEVDGTVQLALFRRLRLKQPNILYGKAAASAATQFARRDRWIVFMQFLRENYTPGWESSVNEVLGEFCLAMPELSSSA